MMTIHRFSVRRLSLTPALALALALPALAQETGSGNVPPDTAHPAASPEATPREKPAPASKDETAKEEKPAPGKSAEPEAEAKPEPKAAKPSEKAEDAEEPEGPVVDEDAVKAVVDMSKRLAELDSFAIRAELTWEEVLENGEKILAVEQVEADVLPPHGLRMERMSPGQERIFFYDGRNAVLWGPITRYYTSVPFKGSLSELAIHLADKYAYELPLADLFLWGRDKSNVEKIKAANFIGEDRIGDRICNHYAYRQENVDWQIWIDKAEGGLPCRYAIIDLTDPARPLFEATVEIDPDTEFFDKRFTFSAPKDAAEIPMATTEPAEGKEEEEKKQE